MAVKRDPSGALKQKLVQINDPDSLPINDKLKKILIYLVIAIVVSIIVIIINGVVEWIAVISMPAVLGLAVYAGYLRYKQVIDNENKLPEFDREKLAEHFAEKQQEQEIKDNKDDSISYS